MAPTFSEMTETRRYFSLEEHLQRALRLNSNEGVRCTHHKRNTRKVLRFTTAAILNNKMGLVVDQGMQEGDSPGLPCSNTVYELDSRCRRSEDSFSRKDGIIDITLRTMALARRNQLLQKKLTALQLETRAFVKSVVQREQNNRHQVVDQ